MKIGILGAGTVGGALGKSWAARGHQIMFSSREPESDKMRRLVSEAGPNAKAATVQETLAFGDVILLAIPWSGLPDVLRSAGDWTGKLVIDATNRFGPPPSDSVGSPAHDIASITGASVVKAFNTIGVEHMDGTADFNGLQPTMFIAGDNADRKDTVRVLAEQLNFEAVDIGGLDNAPLLDNLARLWVSLAYGAYGRNIAFKLLRK